MTQAAARLGRMDHFRLRKYRGPEVWAVVRLAYGAGENGPSVAQRFDIGLANLGKKCRREGWSRRDQAERSDRELPVERIAAVEARVPGRNAGEPLRATRLPSQKSAVI